METYEIRNVSFSYPERQERVLDDLSLTVEQGDFVVLLGPSGCGKTTLLRQLKPILSPHGVRTGEILFEGQPLDRLDHRSQSQRIGFVQQNPDNQIVTDKVWHELAFGLESLGYDTPTIRKRVAEMASFFGIQGWFHREVQELSGGQKQLLNLASVMVMQPSVLILDEPTSQLDPIAASEFLAALGKINRELGTTVLLTEHRLEEAFSFATKAVVMDRGTVLCSGLPHEVGEALKGREHGMFLAMPTAMRVWAAVDGAKTCPVTVREGRNWLLEYAAAHPVNKLPPEQQPSVSEEIIMEASELWFRYEKERPDVVRGLSVQVRKGELLALLGGNGTGKTTTLKLLTGLLKPYRGQIQRRGTIGVLPQDPQTVFLKKTVREDLFEILRGQKLSLQEQEKWVARVVGLCHLEKLLDRHPFDLSGGEQQRAALAKVLLPEPDVLMMDEPTKGLDAEFKAVLGELLTQLLHSGVTVVMVSHDIEFCARYANRCAMVFDGSIVTEGAPRSFFSGNSFYTTSANRMARFLEPEAVTTEDLIRVCGGTWTEEETLPRQEVVLPPPEEETPDWKPKGLPWWRKLLALLSGGAALWIVLFFLRENNLTALIGAEGLTALSAGQLWGYGGLVAALLIFGASISRRSKHSTAPVLQKSRKLPKRTVAAAAMILMLVPLTLLAGEALLQGRRYHLIAVLLMLEMMLPFFLVFEGRKPQARELVVIAVLCAIGVAGRAAFFMLPEFKPVWAVTILAGVAFGGESGFLVGAMTMLASNVLFSQGPWTPWQMFAMGLIGFLAGVLFRKGLLRRSRLALCVYGAVSCMVIYGGIMNLAAALMAAAKPNWATILTYYVSGFPVDCVHAVATWVFLWLGAEPMLEKLDRIKVKYGLIS